MSVVIERNSAPTLSDLPARRKIEGSGAGFRLRRDYAKRSSRVPETPLLSWNFGEENGKNCSEKSSGGIRPVISSRKLAAGLWRLSQELGLQGGVGHFAASFRYHHVDKVHPSPVKDLAQSVSASKRPVLYKFPNSAMEGATKWDPDGWKASDETEQVFGQPKPSDHRTSATRAISALEAELGQARTRISELETEHKSSKSKLEQFLRKLSEERSMWRSREHEKIRAIIDDIKADLSRGKKNRQRLQIVNSKLVNELADAKVLTRRYLQEYEKEKKTRGLVEEVCDELAKEIGEDKAEVDKIRRESTKLQEEVEEERRMLQMAEVWREERVQMKLVDAKVMLEEKYAKMNRLVEDLRLFLKSRSMISDVEEIKNANLLLQVAASVNMQDVRELAYEPPNPDDFFAVFEDAVDRETERRNDNDSSASSASELHQTASPEIKMLNKDGVHKQHPNVYTEDDASEWETSSHPNDEGSSYSPDGSDNNPLRPGTQWEKNQGEETHIAGINEVVDAVEKSRLKKVSSIYKLWRSCPNNGDNYKIVSLNAKNGKLFNNSRHSNGAIMSPDHDSTKHSNLSPRQWSSPDLDNQHTTQAMRGGCMEWRRSAQKSSLKAKLLEARMEGQKVQLRQVLEHKI